MARTDVDGAEERMAVGMVAVEHARRRHRRRRARARRGGDGSRRCGAPVRAANRRRSKRGSRTSSREQRERAIEVARQHRQLQLHLIGVDVLLELGAEIGERLRHLGRGALPAPPSCSMLATAAASPGRSRRIERAAGGNGDEQVHERQLVSRQHHDVGAARVGAARRLPRRLRRQRRARRSAGVRRGGRARSEARSFGRLRLDDDGDARRVSTFWPTSPAPARRCPRSASR